MPLTGSTTQENLREAFRREAEATLRCLYFARRADVEGHAGVAATLRALAEGESGHAFGHLELLEEAGDEAAGPGDTSGNLDSAIAADEEMATKLYAKWAAQARKDSLPDVADWFDSLARAETVHLQQLRRLRAALTEE